MPDCTVQREPSLADCTYSVLTDAAGVRVCDLLEPATPFPAGRFPVVPYLSPEHGYVVPRYINIPGHTFIEQHPGNVPPDTKDCQLPGDARGPLEKNGVSYPHAVLNSRATFVKLMHFYGFTDYAVDPDTASIRTALTTPAALRAWLAAHPECAQWFITVLDAAPVAT